MNTNELSAVQVLTCPHDKALDRRGVCEHLAADDSLEYYQKFTGQGSDYDLVCADCGQLTTENVIPRREICLRCFIDFDGELSIFSCLGMLGQPAILERASGLSFSHETVSLDQPLTEAILALQPIRANLMPQCIALTENRGLIKIDLTTGHSTFLTRITSTEMDWEKELSLHLSDDGRMAAVVNTYGQHGLVMDLASGSVIMLLERDDYCIHVSRFPISFINRNERCWFMAQHGTDWTYQTRSPGNF